MELSPIVVSFWDYLNSHAAVTTPVSGLIGYLISQLLQRRKNNAEADSALADGSEKLVRAVVASIDIYRGLADDTQKDATGKIRQLKRDKRDLTHEVAEWRNKYELLLAISKIPGLTPGLGKSKE